MSKQYDPYEKLGLKRIINAATCLTSLGGSKPHPDVFEAMLDASKGFIQIPVLQRWAGEKIAEMLGVEAGHPTAGAVNALMLACAACMFRGSELEDYDPLDSPSWTEHIQQLPLHTGSIKNQFIVMGNARSEYDHAIECAGGIRVQAGDSEGVTVDDLREAYDPEKTAAFYYTLAMPTDMIPIKTVCDLAHEYGVPAIVDAAPCLSYEGVPKKIMGDGADLVIFSGGKQLGGPNNTGILIGRSDLIKLAHLNSYPFDGIGRGAKMSRETIMGLVKSVELFVERDDEAHYKNMMSEAKSLAGRLGEIDGLRTGILQEPAAVSGVIRPSYAWIEMDTDKVSLRTLYDEMRNGDPVIRALYEPFFITPEGGNRITLKTEYLEPGDDDVIVSRVAQIMSKHL